MCMSLLCICREEKNKWMVSGHSAAPPPWATALRTMAPHEIPRQYNYLPDFYRPENYPEIISLWTTAPPGQLPPMKFPPRQLPPGQLPMNSSSLDNSSPENPPIENCPLGCCLPDILPWMILPWRATLRTIASPHMEFFPGELVSIIWPSKSLPLDYLLRNFAAKKLFQGQPPARLLPLKK